ncbi:MAG: sulfatase-like hydrolase/transferase [Acidimicrobiia bacterium]
MTSPIRARTSSRRPNIVLILADDMGYGDFGFCNDGRSETPAIDRLATEGLCLAQHYSASPVCAPARASILTGRYPHRAGAIDTLEGRGLDRIGLGERTVADLLGAAGYATGLVGKWHNGALDPRFHPTRRGFDEFAGFVGGWQRYWDWTIEREGARMESDGRYLTDVLTEEAVGFLGRHRHEPFFLHLAYSAPHFPLEAPDADIQAFIDPDRFTHAVSRIYAMVRSMDRGVAAVLDALDRLGLGENTLVLFSSDNGPQMTGEGDESTARFNCQYRGSKGLVSEGGIRLPMILRWPAGLAARSEIDDLVHFTDWLPTLLAAADVTVPADLAGDLALDGVNVLPLLQGEPMEMPPIRFWQWNRYTPVGESNAAMRDGPWKLVRPAISETMEVAPGDLMIDAALKINPDAFTEISTGPEPERDVPDPPAPQLFDIIRDPFEEHDLAASEPARVARMVTELETWFESVEADRARADV